MYALEKFKKKKNLPSLSSSGGGSDIGGVTARIGGDRVIVAVVFVGECIMGNSECHWYTVPWFKPFFENVFSTGVGGIIGTNCVVSTITGCNWE